jgi:hypothetical protein
MNRFAYALEAAKAPHQQTLMELAEGFYNAVAHAEAEDRDPTCDSAVIVIGSFIAFHVHADVNTAHGYHELLSSCEQNVIQGKDLQ